MFNSNIARGSLVPCPGEGPGCLQPQNSAPLGSCDITHHLKHWYHPSLHEELGLLLWAALQGWRGEASELPGRREVDKLIRSLV